MAFNGGYGWQCSQCSLGVGGVSWSVAQSPFRALATCDVVVPCTSLIYLFKKNFFFLMVLFISTLLRKRS